MAWQICVCSHGDLEVSVSPRVVRLFLSNIKCVFMTMLSVSFVLSVTLRVDFRMNVK